jgi:hypothetical protein
MGDPDPAKRLAMDWRFASDFVQRFRQGNADLSGGSPKLC